MKSFSNSRSPGNDGLKKGFYETFWEELKKKKNIHEFVKPNKREQKIGHIPKEVKDKRLTSNWRPLSILNVDYKNCFENFCI